MSALGEIVDFLLRRPKKRPELSGPNNHTLLLCLASLCLLTPACLSQTQPLPDFPRDKLINSEDIIRGFEQGQTTARVIVNLNEPMETLAATDWKSRPSLDSLHAEILTRQRQVLNTLVAGEFKLRRRFENQAAFSTEVTIDGLAKLADNPMVESIEPVRLLKLHLAQGIPLINGSVYCSTCNGQGVAIAVCDTGIDYRHPRLGGGGFPNQKVIGGYDFGDQDSDPIPLDEAHGTCCAGIAAGDLGTVGDYIGGVAYNAKLYALKVEDSSGYIYDDYIISAWDWCVTHKDDDPCHPILVISNSFGGGKYSSAAAAESASPSLAAAANNAVAAGITILASSGNDGYCNSLAAPAAFSNVISVGAVYDAAFGTYQPCVNAASCVTKYSGGCSTGYYAIDNTTADMVTSYSNTASFLDILAPSNMAYTTDIVGSGGYSSGDYYSDFGGTSAACPYAAGAAACLQSAAKTIRGSYLSPSEVRTILTSTGDNITDGKVAITKPRVNLGHAIESLYTPSGDVAIRGSWVTGATHAKESGDNRALVFIAHARSSSSTSLTTVTYGGQPMTKVIDKIAGSGSTRVYAAAFVLDEADIVNADNSGAFNITWSSTPSYVAYVSVFLRDVNQTAIIGASASASTTNDTSLSTSAISTKDGDMVIDAATCNNTGDYTLNNGFTEAIDFLSVSYPKIDGADGYKAATGADETPSVTHSTSGRQALIGFVVQAVGAAPPVAIYGRVLEADGNTPVRGVLMQTDDNDVNSVTDVNGFYELLVDSNWSGIVTPQKEGYVFEPNRQTYSNVIQDCNDVNYTASLITFKIAGYVFDSNTLAPMNDVNVCADNGGGAWTSRYGGGCGLTDANGRYEIKVDYNWAGNVVPAKYAYVFEPNSLYYVDVKQDFADQNFTGYKLNFKITGRVSNGCYAPVEGVLVDADNGGGDSITDVNGFYTVWVDYAWSGTVTPAMKHYTFDPNGILYVNVLADQYDRNYTAYNICDLDGDCYISLLDLALMADNWLMSGPGISGDFDVDEDVDFVDFAEFGDAWQYK